MTRLMGDATHANVGALAAVPGLQLAAGYDTGTPDIAWTAADWARFPGLAHVHIDQGYNSTPATEAHAIVFDIETGAWAPADAAGLIDMNTSARPAVYVNRSNMTATIASALQSQRWRGDIWLAFPGWQPGQPLPPLPPGCRYVAIQNQPGAACDLSLVLDPAWPYRKDQEMIILRVPMPAPVAATETFLYSPGAAPQHIVSAADQAAFANAGLPVVDVTYGQYQALAGQS